jgi:hypothetical protein
VRLAAGSDGELEYECNCPVGDEGTFCKHAVAVALSWLENAGEEVFEPSEKELARASVFCDVLIRRIDRVGQRRFRGHEGRYGP